MRIESWWTRIKNLLSRSFQVEASAEPLLQSRVAATVEWLESLPELPTDAVEELPLSCAMEEEGATYRLSPEEYKRLLAESEATPTTAVAPELIAPPLVPPCDASTVPQKPQAGGVAPRRPSRCSVT